MMFRFFAFRSRPPATTRYDICWYALLPAHLTLLTLCGVARSETVPPDVRERGAGIYEEHCSVCHDHPQGRVPPKERLAITHSPDYVLQVLTSGAMRAQASTLSGEERIAVAAYLIGKMPGKGGDVDVMANRCAGPSAHVQPEEGDWNGWGGQGTHNQRFQKNAGLGAADVPRLKLKWAFAVPGGASSQATVIGTHVFVPSMSGFLFSLDAAIGCTHWAVSVGAPIRTAVAVGLLPSGHVGVFFGDLKGVEHALDADSGAELWKTVVEEHPTVRLTGAPTFYKGRLYQPISSFEEVSAADPNYVCCTFRGSLVALDGDSGRIVWKSYTISQAPQKQPDGHQMGPSGGSIWSAPTIDEKRNLIYVGTGNSFSEPAVPVTGAIMAIDPQSGRQKWIKQLQRNDVFVICGHANIVNCPKGPLGSDFDIGGSPMLVELRGGKDRIIATSKSGEIFGLDPARRGEVLWHNRIGRGGIAGGIQFGGAADGEQIYVPISDAAATVGDTGLEKGQAMPGVSALSPDTGVQVWHALAAPPVCAWGTPCSNAHASAPTVIPGVVFSGSWDGHERAYSTSSGTVLWDYDTGASLSGVNGSEVHGGSIDQGGQTVSGGRLFVNSGSRNSYPGHGLLVFSVDGK
jgi:polyvinyl alcohol dehydrogenase (cytochrome)